MTNAERAAYLSKIKRTAKRRQTAEVEFEQAVLEAWDNHVPIRLIAEAAGYKSHGTLFQFVKRVRA